MLTTVDRDPLKSRRCPSPSPKPASSGAPCVGIPGPGPARRAGPWPSDRSLRGGSGADGCGSLFFIEGFGDPDVALRITEAAAR